MCYCSGEQTFAAANRLLLYGPFGHGITGILSVWQSPDGLANYILDPFTPSYAALAPDPYFCRPLQLTLLLPNEE
jgi:hypothetical protein